jgi:hypothetical protein
MLVCGKHQQPSLMFRSYSKTLDKGAQACQQQTMELIARSVSDEEKKVFETFTPGVITIKLFLQLRWCSGKING